MITIKRESDLETSTWVFRYHERVHTMLLHSAGRQTRCSPSEQWSPAWSYCRDIAAAHHVPPRVPPDVLDQARRQFVETLRVEG